MVTIIHGDDTASSRNYYMTEKNSVKNPVSLNGEKIEVSEIIQILEGGGLFSEHKSLFIEDLFAKKKSANEIKEIVKIIENNSKECDIFIWEGKKLGRTQISLFKNVQNKLFKFPAVLFQFLDSLKPGNKQMIILFHEVLKHAEPEIVFFMLIRQFRILLALSERHPEPSNCHLFEPESQNRRPELAYPEQGQRVSGSIDELKRLAPWQTGKLEKQAAYFSIDELKQIYKKLFDIDLKQKTGASSLSLEQSIDMLLVNL